MKDKITKIIAKQLKININDINDESSLKYDLAADSIDLIAIISNIEETFKISIDYNEVLNIDTISEIIKYIKEKQNESK